MKKIKLFIVSSLLLCTYSFAQVTTLTFTAKDTNESYIRLDRVVINNLTKNWIETIYYPDTVFIMGVSGIGDVETNSQFSLFCNVPNPFAGVSEFSIQLTESQKVTISVFDAEGRKITTTEKSLLPGEHAFRLLLSTSQTYLLHVRAGTEQASLTVINTGNAGTNRIEYLQSSRSPLKISPLKNRGETDNPFDLGDEMEYYGYAIINDTEFESEHIQQLQLTSESFELLFAVYAIPSVITAEISDITPTSATSGGDVISDGNSSVTARGVCWSISPNPTISDTHTSDGTGLGVFTSSLTGLTANTTYNVRAYATNSVGTAYGKKRTFSTLQLPPCSTGVIDIDGNYYNGIELGFQCWMKENLRVTQYANGTTIPLGSSTSSTVAYRYIPDNNSNNVVMYGYLYNWAAVMSGFYSSSVNPSGVQGICPNGWHVPSDDEWTQLTEYVSSQSAYHCGGNSSYIAKALASTSGWNSNGGICVIGNDISSNNVAGFGVTPAGGYNGSYYGLGGLIDLWSATENDGLRAYYRSLCYDGAEVYRSSYGDKFYGFSVRCLRD